MTVEVLGNVRTESGQTLRKKFVKQQAKYMGGIMFFIQAYLIDLSNNEVFYNQ